MKKTILPAALALLLLLAFTRTGEKDSVAVHFSPTGKERRLTRTIQEHLNQAEHEIRIAMYHWTSYKLAETLTAIHKTKKVAVRVLVDAHSFDIQGAENKALKLLVDRGISVKKTVLNVEGKTADESPRFHHKFCVIDRKTVLTGSFNWTVMGDEANYENLVVIESESAAAAFIKEFDRLWNDSTLAH